MLAFDSGAEPVVVLTKTDLVDDPEPARAALADVALGVPVLLASGITGEGIDAIRERRRPATGRSRSSVRAASASRRSSTRWSAMRSRRRRRSVRRDQRGRHTTVAAELVPMPGEGWLIDTPGVRAVSLWLSGDGIERAFADVFDLMDHCRFRDCKHDREPGCAVQQAIADGELDPVRLTALERLDRGGGSVGEGAEGSREGGRPTVEEPAPARGRRVRRDARLMRRGREELEAAGGPGAVGPNGKPVESVWDFPRPPIVERVDWRIRVVHGGVTIVDAPHAMRVLETSQAPAYYVAPEFVDRSPPGAREPPVACVNGRVRPTTPTSSSATGDAQEASWTYRDPTPRFEPIRDHWAFYAQTLDECWVDDERVDGNEGSFYGGWITANVTGPYKGAAGTMFW